MNLKEGAIVKYTAFCRGINGGGASKSKRLIQYIVDYTYKKRYDCPIYRMHGA